MMTIKVNDLSSPEVHALLREHFRALSSITPPESCHVLGIEQLRKPEITFWSVWDGDQVVGCGALRELDSGHGEVKSMRTVATRLRSGVGSTVLREIIAEAQRRGYRRLSLETGSDEPFYPAHHLYRKFGFKECGPFGSYVLDPNSVFLTLELNGAPSKP